MALRGMEAGPPYVAAPLQLWKAAAGFIRSFNRDLQGPGLRQAQVPVIH